MRILRFITCLILTVSATPLVAQWEAAILDDFPATGIRRIETQLFYLQGDSLHQAHTQVYEFDLLGNPMAQLMEHPDQGTQAERQFEFDQHGNLIWQSLKLPQRESSIQQCWTHQYEGDLLVLSLNQEAGLKKSYQYDAAQRLTRVSTHLVEGEKIAEESYAYQSTGQLSQVIHWQPFLQRSFTFAYNQQGQLTEKRQHTRYQLENKADKWVWVRFAYDAQGKRSLETRLDSAGNPLQQIQYEYDAQGYLQRACKGQNCIEYLRDQAGYLLEKRSYRQNRLMSRKCFSYQFWAEHELATSRTQDAEWVQPK